MTAPHVAVEPWDPSYASPMAAGGDPTAAGGAVDVNREVPAEDWAPVTPEAGPVEEVLFVDGIRRIDARLWVTDADGTCAGVAASFAAGTVRCDGAAKVEACEVRRGLFSPCDTAPVPVAGADYLPMNVASDEPETLSAGVQERMRDLELQVVRDAGEAELVVVDGPLRGRQSIPNAVGYVKTHRVSYLPAIVEDVVPSLRPGQRTPLFVTQTSWSRWSWYVRLPHASGYPWAGIVRCEATADLPVGAAARLADRVAGTVTRFASESHKDGRAPQNLYPIAGLERHLRRMLGDPAFLYRQLRSALSGPARSRG